MSCRAHGRVGNGPPELIEPTLPCFSGHACRAELMRVLAMAVETRKVPMVEAAIDLVQKLVAHQFLVGPVFSISQKADHAARKPAKRRVTGDEDDDLEGQSEDGLPVQVHHLPHVAPQQHQYDS